MRAHVFLGVVAVAWAAGVACSGASDTGLFGGGAGANPNGGSDSGSSTTGQDGGSTTGNDDASTGPMDSSTPLPDAAEHTDSGNPPPKDSGPPPPSDPGVQCGDMNPTYCPVPSESCCRIGQSNYTYSCMPSNGQCQGLNQITLDIPCDDATDCATAGHAGQVCCATYGNGQTSGAYEVLCRDPSECNPQFSRFVLCDKNDPSACSSVPGTSCTLSTQSLKGYYICK